MLETLPVELLIKILKYLTPNELTSLFYLNKYFYDLCRHDFIWKYHINKNYGHLVNLFQRDSYYVSYSNISKILTTYIVKSNKIGRKKEGDKIIGIYNNKDNAITSVFNYLMKNKIYLYDDDNFINFVNSNHTIDNKIIINEMKLLFNKLKLLCEETKIITLLSNDIAIKYMKLLRDYLNKIFNDNINNELIFFIEEFYPNYDAFFEKIQLVKSPIIQEVEPYLLNCK